MVLTTTIFVCLCIGSLVISLIGGIINDEFDEVCEGVIAVLLLGIYLGLLYLLSIGLSWVIREWIL